MTKLNDMNWERAVPSCYKLFNLLYERKMDINPFHPTGSFLAPQINYLTH